MFVKEEKFLSLTMHCKQEAANYLREWCVVMLRNKPRNNNKMLCFTFGNKDDVFSSLTCLIIQPSHQMIFHNRKEIIQHILDRKWKIKFQSELWNLFFVPSGSVWTITTPFLTFHSPSVLPTLIFQFFFTSFRITLRIAIEPL